MGLWELAAGVMEAAAKLVPEGLECLLFIHLCISPSVVDWVLKIKYLYMCIALIVSILFQLV